MFDLVLNEALTHQATAVKYFVVYSRFEYALKAAGYISCDRGLPKADWRTFASECDELEALAGTPLASAMRYLDEFPPKRLECIGSLMLWRDAVDEGSRNEVICRRLGRARNNLFHGQKVPYDEERDEKLLLCCLCILEALLAISPNSVSQRF